ncbi:hypothetical protein T492DRAFT_13823 [Pavlovales sp. CCMP2436]|nr:hypothetical protein T492DRAFT_13823 [Pavlovales sp. CCMP2436]
MVGGSASAPPHPTPPPTLSRSHSASCAQPTAVEKGRGFILSDWCENGEMDQSRGLVGERGPLLPATDRPVAAIHQPTTPPHQSITAHQPTSQAHQSTTAHHPPASQPMPTAEQPAAGCLLPCSPTAIAQCLLPAAHRTPLRAQRPAPNAQRPTPNAQRPPYSQRPVPSAQRPAPPSRSTSPTTPTHRALSVLADDLIYGRDLDARPNETPLGLRPEYGGAAGIASKAGEYEYVAWSTSNKFVAPRDVIEADPHNPSSRPYAGMRTSLTFRSTSTELPEHMQSFIARDFTTLQAIEQMRKQSLVLNTRDDDHEAEQVATFDAEIQLRARQTRNIVDFRFAGADGLVNDIGEFNDYSHAGKDTVSAVRL